MSSTDEKSRDNSPASGQWSRTSSRGSSRGSRRPQASARIIEFVDSRDSNVTSAIQRHKAYHSAAQRRVARLRSLRRGNRPRYLEWGRRPASEPAATSPTIDSGTTSAHLTAEIALATQSTTYNEAAPQLPGQPLNYSAPESLSLSPQVPVSAERGLIIQNYLQNICESIRTDPLRPLVIAFICREEVCTELLLAYCYATFAGRNQRQQIIEEQELRLARRHMGRGTNLLWNQLRDRGHASSHVNIQAVLLLVAYTSDFGQGNEVDNHADALRTMVAERNGVAGIQNNVLRTQLASLDATRKFHLTLASCRGCEAPMRFPQGIWSR